MVAVMVCEVEPALAAMVIPLTGHVIDTNELLENVFMLLENHVTGEL